MTKEDPAPGALAGLRVVEVGEWVSAPFAAKLFADFGADVVKVERPGPGDPARTDGPFPDDRPGPNSSGLSLRRCGSVGAACSPPQRRVAAVHASAFRLQRGPHPSCTPLVDTPARPAVASIAVAA